jgi:DNA-binding CsgD family transcriptional regulator
VTDPDRRSSGSAPRAVGARAEDAIQLSPRQRRVAEMLAQGRASKDIAAVLGIGVPSVKKHVSNLMRKFRARSRADVARRFTELQSLERSGFPDDLLEHIVAKAPFAVGVVRGPDLIIEFVNDTAVQLSGGRAVVGRGILELFPEFADSPALQALREAMRDGVRRVLHEERVRLDGRGITYSENVYVPLEPDANGERRVLTFTLDITDHVRSRIGG